MKNTPITILFVFFLSFNLMSQENNFYLAKVVDSVSNESISFATIRINNTERGLIADEQGNFRVPLEIQSQKDSLIISSIGFKTTTVNLKAFDKVILNIIKIAPKVEILETVTITKNRTRKREPGILTAEQIIKNAIQNIKTLYPVKPFSYLAYYRDYQVFENQYLNLNEGLFEVFDAGFKTNQFSNKENKTTLYSYALNRDFKQNERLSIPYDNKSSKYIKNAKIPAMGGNELSILQLHDPIRNHDMKNLAFIYNWETDFIKNHDFELVGTTFLNDKPIYEIKIKKKIASGRSSKFKFKLFVDTFKVDGTIYVSKGNFAIHKIVYAVYESESKTSKYAINLEYTPKNNLMYLNYLSFNNSFKVKDENSFKTTSIHITDSLEAVRVNFNNPINESTLKKKNMNLYYANTKLPIKSIEWIEEKAINITFKKNTVKKFGLDNGSEVSFKGINVLDTSNRNLDEQLFLTINQFREIFVQEVFPNKQPTLSLKYINKSEPLPQSELNRNDAVLKYWLNTPLKKTKD